MPDPDKQAFYAWRKAENKKPYISPYQYQGQTRVNPYTQSFGPGGPTYSGYAYQRPIYQQQPATGMPMGPGGVSSPPQPAVTTNYQYRYNFGPGEPSSPSYMTQQQVRIPTYKPAQEKVTPLSILNSPVVRQVQQAEKKNALYNQLNPPDITKFLYNTGLLAKNVMRAIIPPAPQQVNYGGGGGGYPYYGGGGRGGWGGYDYTPATPTWYADMVRWNI